MHIRLKSKVAGIVALSVTAPGLLALAASPASAGTGGGTLLCKSTDLAPEQDAPFPVSVTAGPTGPKAPTGASIAVNNAAVTVTLPGPSVGALKAQAGATAVSLTQGIVKLDATHATGSLQATGLSAPSQTITNYSATGGPGGTPTADPITFTINGVNFGTLTTNGVSGQSVDISMAADSGADGFILGLSGAVVPTLGFGSLNHFLGGAGGDGFCANDTAGASGASWAPAVASVPLVQTSFTNTARPTVAGKAKVGRTLTCRPGSWSPAPTATAFRWLRDGKPIKKRAANSRYRIVAADAHHRLSCGVTVSAPGYTSATATSGKTKRVTF